MMRWGRGRAVALPSLAAAAPTPEAQAWPSGAPCPGSSRAPPPSSGPRAPRGYLAIVPAEGQVAGRGAADAQRRRPLVALSGRADRGARGLAHVAVGVLAAARPWQADRVGPASAARRAGRAAAAHAVGVEVDGLVLVGALHRGEHAAVLLARGLRRATRSRQVHGQVVLRVPRTPPVRHTRARPATRRAPTRPPAALATAVPRAPRLGAGPRRPRRDCGPGRGEAGRGARRGGTGAGPPGGCGLAARPATKDREAGTAAGAGRDGDAPEPQRGGRAEAPQCPRRTPILRPQAERRARGERGAGAVRVHSRAHTLWRHTRVHTCTPIKPNT